MKTAKFSDEFWMKIALEEAKNAYEANEVPVGAIIVKDNQIIAKAHNQTEYYQNSLMHAEMLAIKQAIKKLGKWLYNCSLYVTLEPCVMCAGAIVLSRLYKVVFATKDPKAGACGTLYNITQDKRLNHQVEIKSDVLKELSKELLTEFFNEKRGVHKQRPVINIKGEYIG